MKKRSIWADLVRILAIYLVLVIHSSFLPERIQIKTIDLVLVTFAIAATCVPIFVMLSGALLLEKKETYKNFFKKRFLRLISPWVIWSVIYMFVYEKNLTSISHVMRAFITQFESFWFLPMISGLYLFTPAIRIFVQSAKKKDLWIVFFLWFFLISLFPYTRNSLMFPRHVDDGLLRQIVNYSGYFLLGYLLIITKISRVLLISFFCLLIGLVWTVCGIYITSLSHGGMLVRDFYDYVAPGIVLLSTGIFLCMLGVGRLLEPNISKIGRYILFALSTSALSIYFAHRLIQTEFFLVFHRSNIISFFPFDNFINGAILFIISFLALSIVFTIPFAKKFLT